MWAIVTTHRNDGTMVEFASTDEEVTEGLFNDLVAEWTAVEQDRWGDENIKPERGGRWATIDDTVSLEMVEVGFSWRHDE